MIYTIGSKYSYDRAIAEGDNVKMGRQPPSEEEPNGYPGGIVFPSRESAQAFIDNGNMDRLLPRPGVTTWEVYGLLTTWESGTYVTESGERALLHDTTFVALPGEKAP